MAAEAMAASAAASSKPRRGRQPTQRNTDARHLRVVRFVQHVEKAAEQPPDQFIVEALTKELHEALG